jgi:hypothetical protein
MAKHPKPRLMRVRLLGFLLVAAVLVASCAGANKATTGESGEVSGPKLRSLGVHLNPETGLLVLTAGAVTAELGSYPDLTLAWANIEPLVIDAIPETCRGSIEQGSGEVASPLITTRVQYRQTEGGAPLSRELIMRWSSAVITLEGCGQLSGDHIGARATYAGSAGPQALTEVGRIWEMIPVLSTQLTGKSPSLPVRLSGQMILGAEASDDGSWIGTREVESSESNTESAVIESTSDVRALPRATADRPGPNVWDVKFFYVTFKDGPDASRDTNGEIDGIATDVNRYMESQFPGHRIRYDTFGGPLDIQYIKLPITNEEYYRLHTNKQGGVENLFQRALADAGYTWRWGSVSGELPVNSRIYYLMVEGFRGKKFGDNGESYDYECTGGDLQFDGLAIRHLRRLNGEQCPGVVGNWVPTSKSWADSYSEEYQEFVAPWPPPEFPGDCIDRSIGQCRPWGWTMIYHFISIMLGPYGRRECDYVINEIIATPTPQRPYVLAPPNDIWQSGSQFDRPLGHPELATLDPEHSRYFRITNGPKAGDPCRDIQYSPFWEMTDAASATSGSPVYLPTLPRSPVDRPGVGQWDVKFLYVTFKGGPDSKRDEDGSIAAMASEVNRYFQSQFPGNRVRFDWYKGALDVQHVELPFTNKEFQDLFLRYRAGNTLPSLDTILQKELAKVGLQWESGYMSGRWNTNKRGYVLLLEGHRGPKFYNGEWQKMVCRHWDNEYAGLIMRFLRDENGDECTSLGPRWVPSESQWADAFDEKTKQFVSAWPLPEVMDSQRWWGWDVTRGIIELLALMPGCEKVTLATIALPGEQHKSEALPETDMVTFGSRADRPIGHPEMAAMDPARRNYFKIDNGPYVGDKCRDVQYSPYWESIG